jgi:pyruvate dehydrogenase E1 component alpha subunit
MLLEEKFEDKLAALYIGQKSEDFYIYIMVRKQFLQVLQWTTKDKMITAYRNHVQPIGMGVDPKHRQNF